MSLNIKNAEAVALIDQLANVTGESKTQAVATAVQERLQKEQRKKHTIDRERIRQLQAELKRHIKGPISSSDHADFYDEIGLPK